MDLQQVSPSIHQDYHLHHTICQQQSEHCDQSLMSLSKCLQNINVDWVHVENRASDIAKSDKGVELILGQLIDE